MPYSYRVGNRKRSTESHVLRSLFELRKLCKDFNGAYASNNNEQIELTFWNVSWTFRIVQSIRKLFVKDGRYFSAIKFFDCDIYVNGNNELFVEIISIIMAHNVTKSLIIKQQESVSDIGDMLNSRNCEPSSRSCPLDDSTLTTLREVVATNSSLKSLRLSGVDFTSANNNNRWLQNLIKSRTITKLDLSGSRLSHSGVLDLSKDLSINTTLKSLNMSRCYLNDQSIAEIVRCVQHHPTLSELNLSRNYLAKSDTTQAVDAITSLLRNKKNNNITSLDLSFQQQQPKQQPIRITPTEIEGKNEEQRLQRHNVACTNALNALSTNKTITTINLSGNIGWFSHENSLKALSSCLVSNTTLRCVDISSCHLDTDGIKYIAQNCVPYCGTQLKSLIIFAEEDDGDTNLCSDESISFILSKGLQSNMTLMNLGGECRCKTDYVQHLLNCNRIGRRAFRSTNLQLATWPYLLERAANEYNEYDEKRRIDADDDNSLKNASTSVLYELLRGPALFDR